MNKLNERINIDKQEEVVSALWDYAKMLKERKPDCKNVDDDIELPLSAVGETLERILKAFGYKVANIQ